MPYYAVQVGYNVGIYTTWGECEVQVKGYSGARHQKFNTWQQANDYINQLPAQYVNPIQLPIQSMSQLPIQSAQLPIQYVNPSQLPIQSTQYTHPTQSMSQLPTYLSSALRLSAHSSQSLQQSRSSQSLQQSQSFHSPISPQLVQQPISIPTHVLYTDGSCRGNGTPSARGGYGIFSQTHPHLTSYGPLPPSDRHTNQRAELTAILQGLRSVPLNSNVEVITDSKYSIDCVTKWSIAWERKNWKVDKCNLDLIRGIKDLMRMNQLRVQFTHVRGHQGNYGNEQADQLANMGADMIR